MSTTSSKPRLSEDERFQRDLRLAAHAGWFAYVFTGSWLWVALPAWAAGAIMDGFYHVGTDPMAVWHFLLRIGFLTWGTGFLIAFRILFRSIDRVGKRKLARQRGLLA